MKGLISLSLAVSATGATGLSAAYSTHGVDHAWLFVATFTWWLAGMFIGAQIQSTLNHQ